MSRVAGTLLIVGLSCAAARGQVNLPEGFEIVEFADSDYFTGAPSMNNCGQIMFDQQLGPDFADKEMFLYDNGSIKRLTDDNVSDRIPSMNEAGDAVWRRKVVRGSDTQLALYTGGELSIFAENEKGIWSGSISNRGDIAWAEARRTRCPMQVDILLWDGRSVRTISDQKRFVSQIPDINDLGNVAWMHTDFCVNPWKGDIRLWSNGDTIILPSDRTQAHAPKINNLGQVVWNATGAIEMWQDGQTIELVEGIASVPNLNNLGDVYFALWDRGKNVWQPWLYRVSGGGDPVFHRLVDDKVHNGRASVNDWGEVVWTWDRKSGPSGGLRLMRRIRTGDSEFDGAIDLIDYATFVDCMTGPDQVDRLCDCRFLDIDYDGDVDLGDFAMFQNAFEGR